MLSKFLSFFVIFGIAYISTNLPISAIAKNIRSEKIMHIKSGDWIVSSNVEIPDNVTLKVAGGTNIVITEGKYLTIHGTMDAPITRLFTGNGKVIFDSDHSQVVYPQWWGAKGDGITDDTAALQAAVNSFTSKGGEIYISNGVYTIDSLGMKSNITVRGNGETSILQQKSGAMYCISTSPTNNKIDTSRNFSINQKNINFNNLFFRGTVVSDGFKEPYHLLFIESTSQVTIHKCTFSGFRGDGVMIYGGKLVHSYGLHSSNISITECIFDGINKNNRNGVSVLDCDGLLIKKCSFKNCTRSNMPGAIDIEPDMPHDIVRNIKIDNNSFENIGGVNTIQFLDNNLVTLRIPTQQIEITNNVINGVSGTNGIYVVRYHVVNATTAPTSILISNNKVKDTKRSFVIIGVKDIKVENNLFDRCELTPYISDSTNTFNSAVFDIKITGNTFKNLSQKDGLGLSIFGVENIEFINNVFDNIGKSDGSLGYALFFRKEGGPAKKVTIRNNTFKGKNTTIAIQRAKYQVTHQELNHISNNIFLGSSVIKLPSI